MKKQYLSVLNFISCFAVIALHVNGGFWVYSNTRSWMYANIIESLFYFAVPIFFMITGATLLDYKRKYSTSIFLKKRFFKTVIPFFVWSIVSFAILFVIEQQKFSGVGLNQIVNGILSTRYNESFWYFPQLFAVYLSLPLFASIGEQDRKITLEYLIFSTFCINVAGLFLEHMFKIATSSYFVAAMSGYLFFVVAGFYISEYGIKKSVRVWIYILGFIGLCMHIIGTHILSREFNQVMSNFKGYLNLPSTLYAVSIFTFFKYAKIHKSLIKVSSFFENQTFGIYLVHWCTLKILSLKGILMNTLIDKIIWTIGVFLISWVVVCILQKIPILKKIV